jgi:hypothetical protein
MSVPSVGKEEPNFTKHSTIRSYCTVFCEVQFLFTYRRNAHVLLYCVLWSSVPLYPQKERSCLIVLCFVKFCFSLPTEETLMCYCTVFCEIWFLFTYRRNTHVLLYCGLWSSVPLYLQKEHSCLIVLCFVMFGSSPSVGKEEPNITKHSTIRHERSFCR